MVDKAIGYLRNQEPKKLMSTIVVSDSIIISFPLGEAQDKASNLNKLCVACATIQSTLALYGIWIRGAISCGDVHISSEKDQIVGPAYINSYLLESKIAVYPRIIIDNGIINELNVSDSQNLIQNINMKNEKDDVYWNTDVIYDWNKHPRVLRQDVALFIDYLSPFLLAKNGEEKAGRILENIKTGLYGKTVFYEKYRWILEYFKSICSTYYSNSPEEEKNHLNNVIDSLYKL